MTATFPINNSLREVGGMIRTVGDMLFAAAVMIITLEITMFMIQPLWLTIVALDVVGLIEVNVVGMIRLTAACLAYAFLWGVMAKPDLRISAIAAASGPSMAIFLTALAVFGAAISLVMWAVYFIGKLMGLF